MNINYNKIGSVLVVGGGIAGVQSALDLAECGFYVYLVESNPSIGGCMAQLDKTFPTNDCSMCILAPKLVECARHFNIEKLTYSEILSVDGNLGNFKVKIIKKPRYVNDKCTGCGVCAEVCRVKKVLNEFNEGLNKRSAIYLPFPQAVPLKYTIDARNCLFLTRGKCGKKPACLEVCQAGAIDFSQREEIISLEVGSIILSVGYEIFDAALKQELGYGRYKNVITSLEFERILSASGPYQGEIKRPSDERHPKKIAFIQCVGSRDVNANSYCSSVCCMYATKEAIVAKEHDPQIDPTIFYMDIRAFGKGFEAYYERAKNEYNVRFVRSRVAEIIETNNNNLIVRYATEDDKLTQEEFDLVVLSVGLEVSNAVQKLAGKLGINLNQYNFCSTGKFSPIQTSIAGIFVAGAFQGPKDIPEVVMQASASAAACAELLSEVRGTKIKTKEYPQEIELNGREVRVGVFVCHCGINIASVVDVEEVAKFAKTLPNVVYTENTLFSCSEDALKRMKDVIKEYNLNRVVVASCTPRTHEALFQETIREVGLNKYLFEMADIREQCSWVHQKDSKGATEKAKELVAMTVAKARLLEPLTTREVKITPSALVIGGGLSGMTAALSLSWQGFEVHLIEKDKELGGNLRKIYYTEDGADVQSYIDNLIKQVEENNLIHIYKETKVKEVTGSIGNFKTKLSTNSEPRTPNSEISHGVIIVATGATEYKPKEYLYGQSERIITQLELEERLANSELRTPNSELQTIVMIQCVGTRTEERKYCSRLCCLQAIKNALKLKELKPKVNIYILYRDIRTYGLKEEYYREAQEKGIVFIRYDENQKPEVSIHQSLTVEVFDQLIKKKIKISPDLIVLSVGIIPYDETNELSQILKVPVNEDGFFLEAHVKLRPVDFSSEGIFLCGLCHSPKLIEENIAQAKAAAARAGAILSKQQLEAKAITAVVEQDKCAACLTCIRVCVYDAPFINPNGKAEIEVAKCQGCGTCAGECPNRAIQLYHFKDNQIISMIESLYT